MSRSIVLLKKGEFEVVSCEPADVFRVASARSAGICGAFEDRASAERFASKLRQEQMRWPGESSGMRQPTSCLAFIDAPKASWTKCSEFRPFRDVAEVAPFDVTHNQARQNTERYRK
jgi:hypothetical protein